MTDLGLWWCVGSGWLPRRLTTVDLSLTCRSLGIVETGLHLLVKKAHNYYQNLHPSTTHHHLSSKVNV